MDDTHDASAASCPDGQSSATAISRTRAQEHLECRTVEATLGDDHVGVSFARLDEPFVCWPDGLEILLDHELRGSAAFGDVTL